MTYLYMYLKYVTKFSVSPSSSCSINGLNFGGNMTTVPHSQLEMLEATHRGLHKFNPRHHDEIEVEIGDPIYVQKEADDLWCEGTYLSHKSIYKTIKKS